MFHEITIDDKNWMDEKFAEENWNACEYTFANNFVWRKIFRVEVAECDGCLVIRDRIDENEYYSFPIGNGNKKQVIEKLLTEKKKQGEALQMRPLSEDAKKKLQEWFPGRFLIAEERNSFDYIYSREKLATLSGKKLHGKRNHIARFKDGDDWLYEEMNADNMEECRTMTYQWMRMRSDTWSDEMEKEVMVLHEAFDHMEELNLIGGILRKAGEIVAFSIGEPINKETFVVHFEKAYPDMQGAYPMINQQFVLHVCENYEYVNREEDTGAMGLRKAKLSYYPEILLKKYSAKESHVIFAERKRDEKDIVQLWQESFGEKEEDALFYLDGRMTDENMLVIREDGKVVSMASFLPVNYMLAGEYIPARYVYAVATLPQYRGKGFAAEIITTAQKMYQQPLLLVPAEESLKNYYEKLGFQMAFSTENKEETQGEVEECAVTFSSVTPAEYAKIRDAHFKCDGYVSWDEDAVAYAMAFAGQYGGETFAVTLQAGEKKKTEVLMVKKKNEQLIITETTLSPAQIDQIRVDLLERTHTKELMYSTQMGMLYLPDEYMQQGIAQNGYLNLTLD